MNLTPEQCAYVAGIIDGEGTIGINFKDSPNPRYSAVVRCNMYTDEPLATIGRWVGQPTRYSVKYDDGRTYWWLTGPRVRELLILIRPYLILKAHQADLLLRLIEIQSGARRSGVRRYSEDMRREMHEIHLALRRAHKAYRAAGQTRLVVATDSAQIGLGLEAA